MFEVIFPSPKYNLHMGQILQDGENAWFTSFIF